MSKKKRTPSGAYTQNWKIYNKSQVHEKENFLILNYELCKSVEALAQKSGRPRLPLSEMIFCMVYKVYSLYSSRRFMSDLRNAFDRGFITYLPHHNTISRYMGMDFVTPLLQKLVELSGQSLASVETFFAVDSTGLSTCQPRKWYNRHTGKVKEKRDWRKLHCICGVQTNIITCAEVSDGHAHDSPFFKELVQNTARNFTIAEVSADAAYIAAHNQREVLLLGAFPYIAYRSNCTTDGEFKSTFWKLTLKLYQERNSEFMAHYFKRNNVESTFSMLKAKFSGHLLSKSKRAQINEALCKVVCHNLCVVIHSMAELGIKPDFRAEAGPEPKAPSIEEVARMAMVENRIAALKVKILQQTSFKSSPPVPPLPGKDVQRP